MILGYVMVQPIPLPPSDESRIVARSPESGNIVVGEGDRERDPLLDGRQTPARHLSVHSMCFLLVPIRVYRISPPLLGFRMSRRAALNAGFLPDVHGKMLFSSTDFWLLSFILSLCKVPAFSHRFYS